MLAGDGVEFLYTAISRCKAPPILLSIYMVLGRSQAALENAMGDAALAPRSNFFARERGAVNRRSK